MKKLWQLLPLVMVLSACIPREKDETEVPERCYVCTMTTVKVYCDTTVVTVRTEDLKCGWSAEDAAAFEAKNTFTLDEKCFFMVQTCKCERDLTPVFFALISRKLHANVKLSIYVVPI